MSFVGNTPNPLSLKWWGRPAYQICFFAFFILFVVVVGFCLIQDLKHPGVDSFPCSHIPKFLPFYLTLHFIISSNFRRSTHLGRSNSTFFVLKRASSCWNWPNVFSFSYLSIFAFSHSFQRDIERETEGEEDG